MKKITTKFQTTTLPYARRNCSSTFTSNDSKNCGHNTVNDSANTGEGSNKAFSAFAQVNRNTEEVCVYLQLFSNF